MAATSEACAWHDWQVKVENDAGVVVTFGAWI